jgi:hypothetical protein
MGGIGSGRASSWGQTAFGQDHSIPVIAIEPTTNAGIHCSSNKGIK